MSTRRKLLSACLLALPGLALCSGPRPLNAEPRTRLAIVVAATSNIGELSSAQLTRAYLGDPVDVGGRKLIPLNRGPSSAERLGFDRAVLKMSPQEVGRYWIDRKIRGQPGAPKAIDPADLYQRVVVKLEGSVGYVRLADVREDVRVLRIDGKLPSEPGYPIEF
jgi:hypothetical protein